MHLATILILVYLVYRDMQLPKPKNQQSLRKGWCYHETRSTLPLLTVQFNQYYKKLHIETE